MLLVAPRGDAEAQPGVVPPGGPPAPAVAPPADPPPGAPAVVAPDASPPLPAVVARGGAFAVVPSRAPQHPALAASVPRRLDWPSSIHLLRRAAPSMWEMMDSTNKPEKWGTTDWATFLLFSVLTAGTLPLIFASMARSRRRRVKRFIEWGTPATAEILAIRQEKTAFEVKISRVSYQFEADGEIHRDVDEVLPVIADRWRPGDTVQVLYMADRDYDSVIVSR
jgi:hypothetical protein